MKKEVRTCDRCGKELNVFSPRLTIRRIGHIIFSELDLCGECSKEFNEFMEGDNNEKTKLQ